MNYNSRITIAESQLLNTFLQSIAVCAVVDEEMPQSQQDCAIRLQLQQKSLSQEISARGGQRKAINSVFSYIKTHPLEMSEVFNSNAAVLDTLLCSLMQIIRGAVIAKLLLQFYNATISEMCFVKNQNIFNRRILWLFPKKMKKPPRDQRLEKNCFEWNFWSNLCLNCIFQWT